MNIHFTFIPPIVRDLMAIDFLVADLTSLAQVRRLAA